MLFNSLAFLVFFPAVTLLYFQLPHRYRWSLLLAASSYFYMYFIPKYLLILAATIAVDYFAGIWISRSTGPKRKALLVLSLVTNCGFLAFFKYFNFLNDNFLVLAQWLDLRYPIPALNIILPIGLSFHTFQAMSYTIEVYRGHQLPERHFGIFALYVMFYPQLVAGPIERPQNLLHQFYEEHSFDYSRVVSGLRLMGWGLFKKMVIADRLAEYVGVVYDGADAGHRTAISALVSTIFFAYQIYCDFSGYSDIAVGSARVMGFTLMRNFNHPYLAQTVGEFWGRWHISLSTWFKDYVYIPLGGSRVCPARMYFNLFITFMISGLWHGASWTYVIWGALNGVYLICTLAGVRIWNALGVGVDLVHAPGLYKAIRIAVTFSLTCVAWVFFRAHTLSDAWSILCQIPCGLFDLAHGAQLLFTVKRGIFENPYIYKLVQDLRLGFPYSYFPLSFGFIILLEVVQWMERNLTVSQSFCSSRLGGWTTAVLLVYGILLFGYFTSNEQFIYFQF